MECPGTFDIAKFKLIYPEFNETEDEIINYYAENAFLRFGCKIKEKNNCEYLWFLFVAHFLEIKATGTVGAVTSASMGSVNGSFDISGMGRDVYWLQTPYGAELYNILYRRDTFKVF